MHVRHLIALCILLAACGAEQEPMMMMGDAGVPAPTPDAGPPPPMMDEGPTKIAGGTFGLLAAGEAQGLTLTGTASLYVDFLETRVSVNLSGLTPGATYPAHLHNEPCAMEGGGHYKLDRSVEEVIEENEVWPTLTVAADGTGTGEATVEHNVRYHAQSVVVHDPDTGDKLACADFGLTGGHASFAPLEAQAASGISVEGSASLAVGANEGVTALFVRVKATGISGPLAAHLHAEPCAMEGGGHYKIDPSVADTVEANELWPTVNRVSGSYRYGYVIAPHTAREDARSVVLHEPTNGDKIYCADLQ